MNATNPIEVTIQVSKQGNQGTYRLVYNSGGLEVRGSGNWQGVNEDMTLKGSLLFTIMPPTGGYIVGSQGHLKSTGDGSISFVLASTVEKTATLTVTSISPAPPGTLSIYGGRGSGPSSSPTPRQARDRMVGSVLATENPATALVASNFVL